MNNLVKIISSSLRAVAASVPYAASIAQAWSEYENRKQQERIEEFFVNFKNIITGHEERLKAIENYIIESGEIPSLIEKVAEKVKREASERKRHIFAQAFSNAILIGEDITCDEKLNCIETLDFLDENDLMVLSQFKRGESILINNFITAIEKSEKQVGQLIVSLKKLESRGLIGESTKHSGVYGGVGELSYWINQWRGKFYEILPFGVTFLNVIRKLN
jgi:hypothetical protein